MAQNTVLDILFGLIELVKGAFLLSIPVFVFVFIAIFVRRALAKKYKWNWFKSSIITTYFLVFSLVFVLYALPILQVLTIPGQIVFPEFQPTILEQFVPLVIQFARLLIVALLLTFLLMPIEFVGLFLFEKISEKTKHAFSVRLFATVFITMAVVSIVFLFIAPWIVTGILYLIFFGFE